MTQRSLAQKVGVGSSHVAMIEQGQRRPSLRLVAQIADSLSLERQEMLLLAYPETKALLDNGAEPSQATSASWRRFVEDHEPQIRYGLTPPELEVLEHLSSLGSALTAKNFLAILTLIRDLPKNK
jgi:transcriptional regulator with XRE-family HTH domain